MSECSSACCEPSTTAQMRYENSAQCGAFLLRAMKKLSCVNIFDAQNVRRRTLFLGIGLPFPAHPACAKRGKSAYKSCAFRDSSGISGTWAPTSDSAFATEPAEIRTLAHETSEIPTRKQPQPPKNGNRPSSRVGNWHVSV